MEVTLLGTGSADGWPNPFCSCASCRTAHRAGEIRGQTSALIDGRLLLDCGPETPRQALRAGADLSRVGAVLVTHAHPDHFDPAMLLYRHWVTDRPMEIYGPQPVLDAGEHWLAGESAVRLVAVKPGRALHLEGYRVRVLPARHAGPGEAVLYDVLGRDGQRLLYATDTGPLTERELAAIADARFDYVLLEETFGDHPVADDDHLNLATFGQTVHAMRDVGAVDSATNVIAVHLGHRNPPSPELSRRLAAFGARAEPDGTTIRRRAAGPAQLVQRTLITGGARSGKSFAAERLLQAHRDVVYVATAAHRPGDADWRRRIEQHQGRRPDTWQTQETLDLVGVVGTDGPPVLIDCLTLWLARMLDQRGAWEADADFARVEQDLAGEFERIVDAWRHNSRTIVAVTNEVGCGVVPETPAGVRFRDLLGRLNAMVAAESDEVLWCVAGRVVPL